MLAYICSMRQLLLLLLLAAWGNLAAQSKYTELQIGYYAPYFSNMGFTIGYGIDLKTWEKSADNKRGKTNRLQLLPQISYFNQPNTAHNLLVNPEAVYKWSKTGKRFYLTASIGTGYLLSVQRQTGTLSLSTGEIDYQNKRLHFFVPTASLGLGVDPRKKIGFFLKAFYGRKFSTSQTNSAFIGLSTGILIKLY